MKRRKFNPQNLKPKNGFSAQHRLSPQVQNSALLLVGAAKALDGVFVMEVAEPGSNTPYAITIAVCGDREKIDQLVTLVKPWTVEPHNG